MTLMSPSRSSSDFMSAFHVACTTAAQRTIRKTPIDIVTSGHPVEVVWTRKLGLSEFLDTACKGQIRIYATAGVKDGFRRLITRHYDRRWMRSGLSPYGVFKAPRTAIFGPLPKTSTGKI